MGGKTERIEKQSEPVREEDITNALMKIVKGEKKTIYFTQGHGEKNIEDSERNGDSNAKGGLEKEGYVVKEVNHVQEGKVADDTAVLVMASLASEPIPNEVDRIDGDLNSAG